MKLSPRFSTRAGAVFAAVLLAIGTLLAFSTGQAKAAAPPATTLGIWNGSPGSIPSGQHPNVLNNYYYWGDTDFSFLSQANGLGATPFVELEPWQGGGPNDCQNGLFASIANNSPAAVTYAKALGTAIANSGKPAIFTFAHEMNISGQYPWSVGNGCGVTAAQWKQAWVNVVTNVRSTAGGLAFAMWAPNVDPNGNDTVAAQYWPGPATVDMTGVDGYPAFCGCGGTFADIFAGTFNEIKGLSGFSTLPQTKIFVSEIDISPLDSGGFESVSGFVSDMCKTYGGDGLLQFQEGTNLSSTQWSELDSALAADCPAGGGGGTGGAPAVTTNAASGVSSSGATLNGSVNPEGVSTTYQFDYGITAGYGLVIPAGGASAGSGTTSVNENAALTGLAPSTTYHYRIEATNSGGTTDGADQQFTTSSGGGGTSVALDSASGGKAANTSSLSWTQTVGTGSSRALLVDETVGISSDAACVPTATYDGIAMTEITVVHTDNQRAGFTAVFGLASNPPSGSDTVHVAVSGCSAGTPQAITGGAESFTGVSQSAPWGAHAVSYGNSTASSVSVADTSASDLVGEFVSSGSQIGTANSPVVQKFIENETNNTEAGNTAGGYAPGAAGTVTGGWNLWQDFWAAAAVAVQHA